MMKDTALTGPGRALMTDRELLAEYTLKDSQQAFAALVDRHAGRVYSTCLRLLGEAHSAEDAAQATFLVLARKARGLPPSTVLAGWLYTVARSVALNLRRETARRVRREREAAGMRSPETVSAEGSWALVRPQLDAALAALPEAQREVLLLRCCYGRSEAEAAAELGWGRSRVSMTLSRALERMRGLLARRGVTVPATALFGMLATGAGAAEAPAALLATLKGLGAGAASASAVSLAEGTMKAMVMAKIKLVAAIVAAVAAAGSGGLLAAQLAAGEPAAPAPRATAPAAPAGPAAPAPASNQWVKLEKADCGRGDAPLVYEPGLGRFMALGGSIGSSYYPKPHPFDELALDLAAGQWENWLPPGKAWGPQFGDCKAPAWKSESWGLTDAEGNCRPNVTRYTGVKYGNQYALDPDSKRVFFYVMGSTFSYDPAARVWKDLAPASHPGGVGGTLYWGSMCYMPNIRKVVLFGGANVQTERGDPGTWTYDPAANVWEALKPDRQPPQRALSPLVYDPVSGRAVLFGGDALNALLADTWTFDGRKWEERKPALSPSPRGGHALVWLPVAKKVLLLGGWGYDSGVGYYPALYRYRPLEAWTYDTAADRWEFIASWDKNAPPSGADLARGGAIRAAAGADDSVLVLSANTWLCRLDVSRPDAAGAERLGAKPGAVERRKETYDPEWYKGAPAADPAKVEAELKALPANTWTARPAPRQPQMGAGWGTAIYSPERDLIMRFSGGHCYYSGTAPQVYDVKTGRWSIPFAPEMPLDFCTTNEQVLNGNFSPGEWSLTGSPWISGHTYKTTGYEPETKTLIYAAKAFTYFFDPAAGRWSRNDKPSPFLPNMYVTTLCGTPQGVMAWAERARYETGLFLLDPKARTWSPVGVKGKLPAVSADCHGMVWDTKRARLLLFSSADKEHGGDVMACDPKTGEVKWLEAAGREKARVNAREATYLADCDMVMLGGQATGEGGKLLSLVYDCEKNAWLGAELAGANPIGKGAFNVDLGLMYDPNRKLVWAVNCYNQVHVLRFDPKTAGLQEIK
ncbi:MAG TPA: sigma-70 family RNA polymerase sigma factor [Planctomycetota bacterium]|nr:sigma-70 family RNA polymerase sigma factor [Planctomycetota bacterium]